MNRVIVVPILDVHRFRGFEEVCRDQSLAALVGDTTSERSRERYSCEEMFLEAVAQLSRRDNQIRVARHTGKHGGVPQLGWTEPTVTGLRWAS